MGDRTTEAAGNAIPGPTATRPAGLDIIAVGAEITQVIQCFGNPNCPDNSVPLYTDRPTLVRLYVRDDGAGRFRPWVRGMLCGPGGECIYSLNSVWVSSSNDPIGDFRGDISRTLNFLLPQAWTQLETPFSMQISVIWPKSAPVLLPQGRIWIKPETGLRDYTREYPLWPYQLHGVEDCCPENNTVQLDVGFNSVPPLDVWLVPVAADGHQTPVSEAGMALRWMRRYFPVGAVNLWGWGPAVDADYARTDPSGWSELLDDLAWINDMSDDPPGMDGLLHYQGVIPGDVPFESAGAGWLSGRESAAAWFHREGATAAHEVGHNLGLAHAPSDRDDAGNLSNRDCEAVEGENSDYPLYSTRDGAACPRSSIGEWGIDLYSCRWSESGRYCGYTLFDPTTTYDLMSYCFPRWMSLYTYGRVAAITDETGDGPAEGISDERAEYLIGSGLIDEDGVRLRRGFYRVARYAGPSLIGSEGRYEIQLRDGLGRVLLTHSFDPQATRVDTAPERGYFHIAVPWMDGTAQIVFLFQENVLGAVRVSDNAPTVTLLEPNGGESLTAQDLMAVRWRARDTDGDLLRAAVLYSADGGQTWRALKVGLTEKSLSLDTRSLPGSESAAIRVCVTDGANTACDESDAPFSVEDKSPQVFILSPTDKLGFPSGISVVFDGISTDPEDGAIVDDAAYVWSSDRDGRLGMGPRLWGLPLSKGRHLITLTVSDKNGHVTSASVTTIITGGTRIIRIRG